MKINSEIKELVKKHYNAVKKISDLEGEIKNLKIAKESLQIQLENQLWDLNRIGDEVDSEVFDATFAIDGDLSIAIIDFCEGCISRVDGIVHHDLAKMACPDEY